jgi:membrane-associated phospholipid phosphatase
MPSLHVGLAAWLAIVVASCFPRLKLIAWAYFAVILFGSVYLGWHYAIDGVAGLAIAWLAWWASPVALVSHQPARVRRLRET